jgi:hypothetical protein
VCTICGVCVIPTSWLFLSVLYCFIISVVSIGTSYRIVVSPPGHPVELVAFHVFNLSTCMRFLTMLITVTLILDSSTSRQLETLMVPVWRTWRLQFDNLIVLFLSKQ